VSPVMPRSVSDSDDPTVYLAMSDFGEHGRAFVETDITKAGRDAIVRNLLGGQYRNALRVVAFNTVEGWARDVSEEIANEILEGAHFADVNFSDCTKRFLERHVGLGGKAPPAPSVQRRMEHYARYWVDKE
jgi:hypothetical protein